MVDAVPGHELVGHDCPRDSRIHPVRLIAMKAQALRGTGGAGLKGASVR